MNEYDNNNRGALWNNDRKQSDKHPDLSGSVEITCPHCKEKNDFWMSGWKKKPGQNDRAPIVSVSVRPKDYKDSQPAPSPDNAAESVDDQIPW